MILRNDIPRFVMNKRRLVVCMKAVLETRCFSTLPHDSHKAVVIGALIDRVRI